MKKFGFYALRWLAFAPALAAVLLLMKGSNAWIAAGAASLVGACLFFWGDRIILKKGFNFPVLQVCRKVTCVDCGKKVGRYRLVRSEGSGRSSDQSPEFRCEACSKKRAEILADEDIPAYMLAAYRFHEARRSP
jgi:hypothetical protein